jgi:hypothetical protein
METITISKEKLQKLLSNFYAVCGLCDEMDIYEAEELDDAMQEMKEWAEEEFGRTIDNEQYI